MRTPVIDADGITTFLYAPLGEARVKPLLKYAIVMTANDIIHAMESDMLATNEPSTVLNKNDSASTHIMILLICSISSTKHTIKYLLFPHSTPLNTE